MNREKILNNIISIRDSDNNIIEEKHFKLYYSVNKYSAKKNSIWHLDLNGKHLSKHKKYQFDLKCLTCQTIRTLGTTQLLRNINKDTGRCFFCINECPLKREKQKSTWKTGESKYQGEKKKLSFYEKKEYSEKMFENLDDDFKDNYFKFHLTTENYNYLFPRIQSFQNGTLSDMSDYEYWPVFKVNNQMKYSSVFYNKNNHSIFKAHQPTLRCDICQETWKAKSLEKFKNDIKITCSSCSFVNKVFCLRQIKNCKNETILYQSKLELKFIKWCNINNIYVKNGPTLSYNFNGKNKKYRVDFQIEDILIEIKDNHIWHRNDINSGKIKAKENVVNMEIENGNYKYFFMIMPKKWLYYLEKIKNLLNKI